MADDVLLSFPFVLNHRGRNEGEEERRSFPERTIMALRAAAAIYIGRQRSSSQLRLGFHYPPSQPLQRHVAPPHIRAGNLMVLSSPPIDVLFSSCFLVKCEFCRNAMLVSNAILGWFLDSVRFTLYSEKGDLSSCFCSFVCQD